MRTMYKSIGIFYKTLKHEVLDSIVVSIPACHAGDRGSIPRRGVVTLFFFFYFVLFFVFRFLLSFSCMSLASEPKIPEHQSTHILMKNIKRSWLKFFAVSS